MAKRPVICFFKTVALFVLFVFLQSTPVVALPAPGQSLEAQAERFRREYSLEKQVLKKKRAKPSIELQDKEQKSEAPGPTFELKAINLTGTTILKPERFQFIWEPFIGKKVSFADINEIVAQIKRLYGELGCLTTTVYLPPQDSKNGEIEIRVLEGKMGNLVVEGNKWFSTASIKKYFHPYRGEVLDMQELLKEVMRLNSNQDLKVSTVLSPGDAPETIDVTLKVKENMPYHVATTVDNQGTRLTGKYRESFLFSTSNLTGNHDSFALNLMNSAFTTGQYVSYESPWSTYGTRFGLSAGYFQGKLGREYFSSDVTTKSAFYNPYISWELYQSSEVEVDLRVGMQVNNLKKREAEDLITNEKLRVPNVGIDFVKTDSTGQTTFSPDVMFVPKNFLGATSEHNPLASREHTGGSFAKYSQSLNRYQRMPWESYIQIRSRLQVASESLPTTEQIQLGGVNSVRGYPEGDYLADTGASVSVDWFFPLYLVPSAWQLKHSDTNVRHQIEPLLFFDMGKGKLKRTLSGERDDKFLAGVGAGVRVHFNSNMFASLQWGVPVGDEPIKGTGESTFNLLFRVGL